MTSSEPLLRARNLHKWFEQGSERLHVLDDVSLSVEPGEMLGIVGVSGAGKSTLLHILGTLERPSAGEVAYRGDSVYQRDEIELMRFRNEHIGFIFQLHYLLPDFTVVENIMLPALIGGTQKSVSRRRATELAQRVGLAERLPHRPGELSGGEQQRVAIARALINQPALILADEPTGDLDSQTGEAICELLSDFNRETGQTFIVVTHNRELTAMMDRVVVLRDGKLLPEKEDLIHV